MTNALLQIEKYRRILLARLVSVSDQRPYGYCWAYSGANIPKYEWAIIDKSGNPIDGWHTFEVEE